MLHDADNSFDNIINKREVTLAVAVIENLNRLALSQLVRKTEISHIGTTRRSIDRKEPKSRRRNIVQFGISMSHQLITFLRCGIK